MSLVARHLEANAIPTVIVGSARDVVEHCGVPRLLFVDFPLGNPMGRPYDVAEQRHISSQALDLLEAAWASRTTVLSDVSWGEDSWRQNFMRVDDTTRAALAAAGEARRDAQRRARDTGRARQS